MKIKDIIWGMAFVACLLACGNDDAGQKALYPAEDNASVERSDVPIQFAPVNMTSLTMEVEGTTRGSVDASNFTVDNLGVFCLSKHTLPGSESKNVIWDGTSWAANRWLVNAKASIKSMGNGMGIIALDDEQTLAFYPTQAFYAYGFAAYHPWTEHVVCEAKTITAYFSVDGNDDIFYAVASKPKAELDDLLDMEVDNLAFSKSYYDKIFQETDVREDIYPHFEFKHLMSRLDFHLRFDGESPTSNKFYVEKVEFDDFPCIVVLDLAKRENGEIMTNIAARPFVLNPTKLKAMSLYGEEGFTQAYGHFELREQDDTEISAKNYQLSTVAQKIGDCILIPPVYAGHSRCNIKLFVTLRDQNGKKYKNNKAFTITVPTDGWEQGKQYTINLTLTPPNGSSGVSAPQVTIDTNTPADNTKSVL